MQTTKNIYPIVRGIQETPFVANEQDRLIYTDELIKAVRARRFFLNDTWAKISSEIGCTPMQAQTAHGKGRHLRINEHWTKFRPELKYEKIKSEPPKSPTKPPKVLKTVAPVWPDDLVCWVILQSNLYTPRAILSMISRHCEIVDGFAPTQQTIHNWIKLTTRQAQMQTLRIKENNLKSVGELTDFEFPKKPKDVVIHDMSKRAIIQEITPTRQDPKLRNAALEFARQLVIAYKLELVDLL